MKILSKKNTAKREPYDPVKHGVSQTLLSTWMECREKVRIKYVKGLKPDSKRAFIQGSSYHDMLEYVYTKIMLGEITGPKGAKRVVLDHIENLEKKEAKVGRMSEELQQSFDFGSVLIPAYFRHYKNDFNILWRDVEEEFSIPIKMADGTIIPLKGKTDGGFMMKKESYYVLESKFKAFWGKDYSDLVILDLQVATYTAAMMHKGHPVKGCRYNLVRKPALRRGKTETRRAFIDRVAADIEKRPETYFERHDVPFDKSELDANWRRVNHMVRSFYDWWKSGDHKEQDPLFNSGACENKYGRCEYIDFCARGDVGKYTLRH